jgi:hypothetical protein
MFSSIIPHILPNTLQTRALFTRKRADAPPKETTPKPDRSGRVGYKAATTEAERRKQAAILNTAAKNRGAQDRRALAEARNLKKGQRMSPEAEAALTRKVGGTARDYFKDYVEVEGKYIEGGWTDGAATSNGTGAVAALGGLTLLAVLAFTVAEFA